MILPNPQFNDTHHLAAGLTIRRSMNNVRYTYIQRKGGRRVFVYNMVVFRPKALEFIDFIRAYGGDEVTVIDHKGRSIKGYITTNPNTLTMTNKSSDTEQVSFNFEIQGVIT
jgi:hypothetical protein